MARRKKTESSERPALREMISVILDGALDGGLTMNWAILSIITEIRTLTTAVTATVKRL